MEFFLKTVKKRTLSRNKNLVLKNHNTKEDYERKKNEEVADIFYKGKNGIS